MRRSKLCVDLSHRAVRNKTVMESNYRPGQALRFPEVLGSEISRPSVHEGGKIVSPTHRPHLRPRKRSLYSFLLEAKLNPVLCE